MHHIETSFLICPKNLSASKKNIRTDFISFYPRPSCIHKDDPSQPLKPWMLLVLKSSYFPSSSYYIFSRLSAWTLLMDYNTTSSLPPYFLIIFFCAAMTNLQILFEEHLLRCFDTLFQDFQNQIFCKMMFLIKIFCQFIVVCPF